VRTLVLRYKLSLRDLVEMMAERGLELVHTTIMRWVQRYVPEFEKSWARYARKVGRSWRVDETYLKVRGRWVYLYRAVDKEGNTVDFRLSPKRDVAAAKAFFRKALRTEGRAPINITLDGYAASHRAVREMPSENEVWKHTKLRSSKYLMSRCTKFPEYDVRGCFPALKFRNPPSCLHSNPGMKTVHIKDITASLYLYPGRTGVHPSVETVEIGTD
jgi:transposase-like protein